MIVLPSGPKISPEEIESHYRQSPFIGELCVFPLDPGEPGSGGLHAVVVPDADVLRQRKIVNVRELIRFELENLSVSLPSSKRIVSFDVTMERLPRCSSGAMQRREISERCRTGQLRARHRAARSAPLDDHLARIVCLVQAAVGSGVVAGPDSNLELDLGLDSMDRVELLASLEQRFGIRVPEDVAQSAFLVRDIAEAFRGAREVVGSDDAPWAALLKPQEPAPEWRVLRKRRVVPVIVFAIVKALIALIVRPRASGLEHLPARGPFIISPNHQSYLDPFVLVGVMPFRVLREVFAVGAAEYFQTPIAAWLARAMNIVPVDPDANLVPGMQAGAFGLRHGRVLALFPEGERSIDGSVKQFRKGAAILAQHLQVPIVPVAIDGMFEIWPRNRPLDWRRLLPWSGHPVRIRIGPPLPPARTSHAEHTALLHDEVERMWIGLRRRTDGNVR